MNRVVLGELIREAKAGFASGKRDDAGVIQLRMNNVDTNGGITWNSFLRVPADPDTVTEYQLRPGDVLFNNTNSTALVGKSALFTRHDEPVVYSNHFTRLRTHEDKLLPNYLASWLSHQWASGVFAEICNQWIGQSAVQAGKLLALSMHLPPLAEQVRIVAELTASMATVEKARLAVVDRLTAAEALSLALSHETFESVEAQAWPECCLQDLLRTPIRTGISKHGNASSEKRCLTLSAVRGRTLNLEASKPVEVTDTEALGNWVRPGNFYVVRGNGNVRLVGRGAFAPDPMPRDMLFPDLLFQIDLQGHIDRDFFMCLWSCGTVRKVIEQRSRTAAGIYKINTANLNSLPLRLPSPQEQKRIGADLSARLADAQALIDGCRAQLVCIEALPAAILRDYFGDTEARNAGHAHDTHPHAVEPYEVDSRGGRAVRHVDGHGEGEDGRDVRLPQGAWELAGVAGAGVRVRG